MEQCLLIIFAPPSVEETMVDWLLENDAIQGFSSVEAFGHGVRQGGMSLLEQVTGRKRRVQFIVHADTAIADRLVEDMRMKFTGVGLHYYILPVLAAGRL